MEQEKNLLDFTQEELFRYIQMQRRIYALEEHQLMKTDLLDKIKRVLDLRDLTKITVYNHKKTRKIINKYAKQYKKEADTKRLFKKQENEEEISLVNAMSREFTLKNSIRDIKDDYDYILIDCMPSLGMITINALACR